MSDFDAYGDEMRRLSLSDEDLDRVLEGIAPSGDADAEELAAFARAVVGGFAAGPGEAMARSHLAAITTEARSASSEAAFGVPAEKQRRARKASPVLLRGGRLVRIGLAVGVLVLCTAGLAVAGVRLPGPAVSVLEELGLGLPNQSDTDEGGGATGEDGGDRRRDRQRGAGERGSGPRSVAPSTSTPARGGNRAGEPPVVRGAPVAPAWPERQSGADRGGGRGGRPEDARPPQGRAPEAGLPPKHDGPPPGRGDAAPPAEGPAPGSGGPPSGGGRPPAETPSGPPAGTGPPDATPFGGPSPGGDFENRGGPPDHTAGRPG